jgi:signal transduction histidine kinase
MTAEILDDRQKLEEASRKLMEAEQLATIGRLATALAHEIRNPLTAVKLNIQKIARHPALGSIELEQLGIAESGIQQVEKLVKDILSYARAPKLAKSSFQLENLLEEALRFVEEPIEEKEIRVVASFEELRAHGRRRRPAPAGVSQYSLTRPRPSATGERSPSRPGFGALLREASPKSRSETTASASKRRTGCRFDAFFTTKSLGTGLGLTNARKVVELHRGAIEVVSEVGRGTKVTVLLPYEGVTPSRETQETIASTP